MMKLYIYIYIYEGNRQQTIYIYEYFLYLDMCIWCLKRSEEDVKAFVTGVEDACEPPCGC